MKRPAPKVPVKAALRAEDPLAYYAPAAALPAQRAVVPVLAVDLMYAYYGTE